MAARSLLIDVASGTLSLKHLEMVLQDLEASDNVPDSTDPILELIGSSNAAVALGQILLTGREPITAESQEDKAEDDPTRVTPDDEDAVLADGMVYPVFEHYNTDDDELTWRFYLPVAVGAYLATLGQAQEPVKEVAKTLIARRKSSRSFWDDEREAWVAMGLAEPLAGEE